MIGSSYKNLFLKLISLLAVTQVIRLLFFIINKEYFYDVTTSQYIKYALLGIRYDASAIATINLPFIALAILPSSVSSFAWYKKLLTILFITVNLIAVVADISDIAYYPYVRKRMTADIFSLISQKSDFWDLLPSYLYKFWYVSVLIALGFVMFWVLNKITNKHYPIIIQPTSVVKKWLPYLFFLTITIIIIRGGFQLKPILPINALSIAPPHQVCLIYTTPFSIIHTFEEKKLQRLNWFSDAELASYFNPIKQYKNQASPTKTNVVILILESFGKCYTSLGGRVSYTPFLDSLMQHSMVFSHAYANSFTSIDGIPAILSGIPRCSKEPFIYSPYNSNTIESIPFLLKKIGYSSAFFHGGTNGTMGFDVYSKHAGFDAYYGRSEYDNDKDYDGTWGIWDAPFLQYCSRQMSLLSQPFFATVFTLSSHEPFHLPSNYTNKEIRSLQGMPRCIRYTDQALRDFFLAAQKTSWYQNTLFVITADHNYLAYNDTARFYNNGMGLYAIPILLYQPNNPKLKGVNTNHVQQIDILPTIMDFVGFKDSFFSFGHSVFDTSAPKFVFNRMDLHTQFLLDSVLISAHDTVVKEAFAYNKDSLLQQPISLNDSSVIKAANTYRAFLQLLYNSLIENNMSTKKGVRKSSIQ